MKRLLFLLSITFFLYSSAQDDFQCYHFDSKGRIREHSTDFKSLILHLDFNTEEGKLSGKADFIFAPLRKTLDHLELDAPGIDVQQVSLDGKSCKFHTTESSLVIEFENALVWETDYNLIINYQAQPEKGLYFLGWNDPTNRARKQIWTQGQGIDNRYWIPSYDDMNDKLYTETYITFANGFEVISNGDLIDKIDIDNGTTLWHYKMQEPHVVYLIMLAIGDFAYKDLVSKSGVISRQYYYPDRPQDFEPSYQYSAEMMDWMEAEFGIDYPWGKIYRNVPVADFLYGAMENTTSTIFTDYYLQNSREAMERNYLGTNAHELTHQWFGDLITEWSGSSHWLHESFATHYAKQFKRSVEGEDSYELERYREMQNAKIADDKNDLPVANSQGGSARHYPKGSIVIDMLRYVVGEEEYKKVIHSYLEKYSFKQVDTHLFYLEFVEVLGLNLDWFFDEWVYRGGYPHYEVSYSSYQSHTEVEISQIQDLTSTVGLFKMPIIVEVHYVDGSMNSEVLQVDSAYQVFQIPNKDKKDIAFVLFDPGNKIYKELTFKKSETELLIQLSNAPNLIDRYFAIKDLESVAADQKRAVYLKVFEKEQFYLIKANIIKQLANDDHSASKKLISKALLSEDMEIRRACIDFTDNISPDKLKEFSVLLKDSSFVTIEKTLLKLADQFPDKIPDFLSVTENDASKNIGLKLAWLSVAAKIEPKKLVELVDYAGPSFEFRTRIKAMDFLEEASYKNVDFIKNLLNASVSFNNRLAGNARKILWNLSAETVEKEIILSQINHLVLDKNEAKRLEVLKTKL